MGELISELNIKPSPDFERLRKVLTLEGNPDRVPLYELFVDPPVMEKVINRKIGTCVDSIDFYYRCGYDYVPVWVNWEMELGSLVEASSEFPIKDLKTFEQYTWPSTADISFAEFEAVIPRLPEGMKIIGQKGGIFECVQKLCGYEGLCYMLLDNRDLVKAVFSKVGELYEAAYSEMAAIDEVGAIVISDDMGYKTQTLISPDDLREFVMPWHKRLALAAHKQGKPCILHSCGQLKAIMENWIIDVRINAKHSYEDVILPVTEAVKIYKNRIAVLGGFDVDRLCRSSKEQVREHTRKLLDECAVNGGYAFGSGNSIARYVPVENYLTMIDEVFKMNAP